MNTVKQLPLNSKDELYTELRDKNFNAVGPTLSRKAKAVSNAFGELKEAKDASSASLLELKQSLKYLKSLEDQNLTRYPKDFKLLFKYFLHCSQHPE